MVAKGTVSVHLMAFMSISVGITVEAFRPHMHDMGCCFYYEDKYKIDLSSMILSFLWLRDAAKVHHWGTLYTPFYNKLQLNWFISRLR